MQKPWPNLTARLTVEEENRYIASLLRHMPWHWKSFPDFRFIEKCRFCNGSSHGSMPALQPCPRNRGIGDGGIAKPPKAKTAPYQYPRAIEFIAEMPLTPTGKIRRKDLRMRG